MNGGAVAGFTRQDFRQQWGLLDRASRREIIRCAWTDRRHPDPRVRPLVVGYARWVRSRWRWAIAYLILYTALFVVPVFTRSRRHPAYLAFWAGVFVVGLTLIAFSDWRMRE